jgi:hypothetical protein
MADSTTRLLDTGARNRLGNKPYTRLYRDYRVAIWDSSILRKTVNGKEYTRNINDDITSISINYNIDAPPATCDIELQSPRHKREGEEQSYNTNYGLLINDFDEIIVYAKNRFANPQGEIEEQEVFRGLVTRIVDSGTGNDHKISLNCSDLLYWWKIMRMNINPSQINRKLYSVGTENNTKQAIFGDRNPYEIIAYITSIYNVDFAFENTVFSETQESELAANVTQSYGTMEKWERRFSEIKARTFFYGVQRKKGAFKPKVSRKSKSTAGLTRDTGRQGTSVGVVQSQIKNKDHTYIIVDIDKSVLQKFKPYELLFIQGLYDDEYKDRLEIAQEVSRICGFEFFQNTNGLIYFKPPFFNLKIPKGINHIYTLEDIDIISADFSSNAEEVVTEMSVQGKVSSEFDMELDKSIRAFYRDGKLAKDYGVQTQNMEITWIRSGIQALQYAISELDKINSNRFQASITIPGRPEMRLGYPIYIPSYDEYWYVTGISHSISPESFTTTITATSKRAKYYHNNQVLKNGVLTMSAGTETQTDRFKTFILQGSEGTISSGSTTTVTKDGSNIKMPLSDEDGYDLIGGFPYGRSYSISAEGELTNSSTGEVLSPAGVGDILTTYDTKQKTKVKEVPKQKDTFSPPERLKLEDTKNSDPKDFSKNTDFGGLG